MVVLGGSTDQVFQNGIDNIIVQTITLAGNVAQHRLGLVAALAGDVVLGQHLVRQVEAGAAYGPWCCWRGHVPAAGQHSAATVPPRSQPTSTTGHWLKVRPSACRSWLLLSSVGRAVLAPSPTQCNVTHRVVAVVVGLASVGLLVMERLLRLHRNFRRKKTRSGRASDLLRLDSDSLLADCNCLRAAFRFWIH